MHGAICIEQRESKRRHLQVVVAQDELCLDLNLCGLIREDAQLDTSGTNHFSQCCAQIAWGDKALLLCTLPPPSLTISQLIYRVLRQAGHDKPFAAAIYLYCAVCVCACVCAFVYARVT